jgi:DNA-binding transcriptional regulator YhcF (GntR family)
MVIRLDPDSNIPSFEQLRAQFAVMVAVGAIPPRTRLPTVRDLAERLALAPGTVARAYRELERDGVLRGEGRRGTFVEDEPPDNEPLQERKRRLAQSAAAFTFNARQLGTTLEAALDGNRGAAAANTPIRANARSPCRWTATPPAARAADSLRPRGPANASSSGAGAAGHVLPRIAWRMVPSVTPICCAACRIEMPAPSNCAARARLSAVKRWGPRGPRLPSTTPSTPSVASFRYCRYSVLRFTVRAALSSSCRTRPSANNCTAAIRRPTASFSACTNTGTPEAK